MYKTFSVCFLLLQLLLSTSGKGKGIGLNFRQNSYKIIHERTELAYKNESYLKDGRFWLGHYNRTTKALNLTFTMAHDETDLRIAAQVYKFMSNEYRYFPIALDFIFTTAAENDFFDFNAICQHGNLCEACNPKKCKLEKDAFYYIYNWIPDETKFPPHMPYGKYKLDISLIMSSNKACILAWYGTMTEKEV